MQNSIKICTLLIFIGINLRFVTENIINALLFFHNQQSGSQDISYHIYTPNVFDLYGDVMMVVVFTIAYLLLTFHGVKKTVTGKSDENREVGDKYLDAICQLEKFVNAKKSASMLQHVHLTSNRQLKYYTRWTKGIFVLSGMVGFGLYLFSKYILSIGVEVLFIENNFLSFALNSVNDAIKLFSSLVFVYVYCTYLSMNKGVYLILYIFFFIRNIFSTHIIGFITGYDLYIVVPFLDILTPVIIFYSISCIFMNYRSTRLFKIIGMPKIT